MADLQNTDSYNLSSRDKEVEQITENGYIEEQITMVFEGVGTPETYYSTGWGKFQIQKIDDVQKTLKRIKVRVPLLLGSFELEWAEFRKTNIAPKAPIIHGQVSMNKQTGVFKLDPSSSMFAQYHDFTNTFYLHNKEEYNMSFIYFKFLLVTRQYECEVNTDFWNNLLEAGTINKKPKLYGASEVSKFKSVCEKSGLTIRIIEGVLSQAEEMIKLDKEEFIKSLKKD